MWSEADRVVFFDALEREPFAYDFYQAMRRIECLYPGMPRWGTALRPQDEPIRLGQEPSMVFSPASLSGFKRERNGKPPRLEVRFFGLLGPNGALPTHLTEYARHRIIHVGDTTFARFLDLLHHRFLTLFYRAWAQAQPTVNLDRPGEDKFAGYVGALVGQGMPSLRQRDSIPDHAKYFHSGALSRHIRNAEGLAAILGEYFRVPVRIEQFVGHWMKLEPENQTKIGLAALGRGMVLGRRVWDRQSKFRVHVGPVDRAQYEALLPSGDALGKLVDWVRLYTNGELFWDVRLILRHEEVQPARLGTVGRLGWTGWLGRRRTLDDAKDLVLDAERLLAKRGVVSQAL